MAVFHDLSHCCCRHVVTSAPSPFSLLALSCTAALLRHPFPLVSPSFPPFPVRSASSAFTTSIVDGGKSWLLQSSAQTFNINAGVDRFRYYQQGEGIILSLAFVTCIRSPNVDMSSHEFPTKLVISRYHQVITILFKPSILI